MSGGGIDDTTDQLLNELRDRLLSEGPTFEKVFCQLFRVRPAAVEAYLTLLDHPESTIDDLAAQLDVHSSSVHRSLSELIECDLAFRERDILSEGGVVYYYTARPLSETKSLLSDLLETWTRSAQERIDRKNEIGETYDDNQ